MPDNPHQRLANYSVAIALEGRLSEDTIIRDIMQCDDPDGELNKLHAEQARKADPVIFFYDTASRLIDVAETLEGDERKRKLREARIMADRMVEEIKRRKMSSVADSTARAVNRPKGNTQALLALPGLMGGGGAEGTTAPEADNAG